MSAENSPQAHIEKGARGGAIRHVLVVDDSKLQRRILSASLLRWGFEVHEAGSGEEALKIAAEKTPDLILSDWMMSGMSGLDLCRQLRADSGEDYSYFILLTSKSEKNEIAQGLDSGADDFLTKPVDSNELRARINAGERLLEMHRELKAKNRVITDTLDELRRVYNSLDSDLIEAKKLQQSLLRERNKVFPSGELSLILRSSGHVGGDLVGFFPAGKRHLGIYGIDVSGHGVSSALMTARLAGYLSAAAPDQNVAMERQADGSFAPRPPEQTIAELNDLVLNEMETEHYFTLLLAFVDLQTGRVTIAQAGHPHPAIQRVDGSVEHIGTGGFPVGLVQGVTFEQFEVQLRPGDRIAILSDGVTECPDRTGTMLGEEGLSQLMVSLKDISGPAFLETLVWQLTEFAGGDDFPDDVSGAVFEYAGQPDP